MSTRPRRRRQDRAKRGNAAVQRERPRQQARAVAAAERLWEGLSDPSVPPVKVAAPIVESYPEGAPPARHAHRMVAERRSMKDVAAVAAALDDLARAGGPSLPAVVFGAPAAHL